MEVLYQLSYNGTLPAAAPSEVHRTKERATTAHYQLLRPPKFTERRRELQRHNFTQAPLSSPHTPVTSDSGGWFPATVSTNRRPALFALVLYSFLNFYQGSSDYSVPPQALFGNFQMLRHYYRAICSHRRDRYKHRPNAVCWRRFVVFARLFACSFSTPTSARTAPSATLVCTPLWQYRCHTNAHMPKRFARPS